MLPMIVEDEQDWWARKCQAGGVPVKAGKWGREGQTKEGARVSHARTERRTPEDPCWHEGATGR